eukprot:5910944-Amphidinium_carterae.1
MSRTTKPLEIKTRQDPGNGEPGSRFGSSVTTFAEAIFTLFVIVLVLLFHSRKSCSGSDSPEQMAPQKEQTRPKGCQTLEAIIASATVPSEYALTL